MAKALGKCIRKMYSKRNKKRLYCAAAQSHAHAERLRTGYAVHRADAMKEWLGAGIFTLRRGADEIDRPQWYLQRKTASHIFKRRIFTKLMSNVFLGKSDMSWPVTSRNQSQLNTAVHIQIQYHPYISVVTPQQHHQFFQLFCITTVTTQALVARGLLSVIYVHTAHTRSCLSWLHSLSHADARTRPFSCLLALSRCHVGLARAILVRVGWSYVRCTCHIHT